MTNKIIGCKIALLMVIGMASCFAQDKATKKLNIIYIMTDDHSYQTISAYGGHLNQTPNLDRIAKEGMLFKKGYVTNAICGPSRAVMLTGKFSHMNGFKTNEDKFDGSQQTFPKLLQKSGYQTAIVGKWHLTSTPTGFDYWNILDGQGMYYNPKFHEMGVAKTYKGYATNITTDLAINWMEEKRDKEKPFCLLLHHKAPHRTWMPDTTHLGMYDNRTFELPDNFYDNYEGRRAAAEQKMSIRKEDMNVVYDLKMTDKDIKTSRPNLDKAGWDMISVMDPAQRKAWDAYYKPIINDFKARNLKGDALAEWKYQRYMKDYLSCIQSLDENIGRLFAYLKAHDLLENTVIIYTSDQGFYMGEHGWFDKRFMYEESFRTPLMVRMPQGLGKKGEVTDFVQNIDFAPTILDLAGVKIPEDIQGKSFLPILKGKKPKDWRKSLYYHYYENINEHAVKKHYGVRTDRYKLIHFYDDIDEWELFDLKKDPKEMHNLINDANYQKVVSELKKELSKLQLQYKDTSGN